MKIIQFIYSLTPGGAERFVVDLSNQLAKDGHDVYIITSVNPNIGQSGFYLNEVSDKVNFITWNRRKGHSILNFFAIIKEIWKIKPDVVNGHLNVLLYMYLPALLFKHVKFIHTQHNPAKQCAGYPFQIRLNRTFFKKLIQPISISKLCDDSYREFYGYHNGIIIDNGRSKIDKTQQYNSVETEILSYKRHEDDKIFIHVARCHEQKNQKMLMAVFSRLLKENHHLILLVAGAGYDSPLGDEIKALKHEGIYFLGAKKNIADYLYLSDYFVLSSHWEGLPISLLEAMSIGVIPICTPAGGIGDVITNNVSGVISNDISEESYYTALKSVITGEVKIDKSNVEKEYKSRFSIEVCANKYVDAYK